MAFCKLLTVLVLIHNIGGLLGTEVRSSIVGGGDAPKGTWPWMVYLKIVSQDGKLQATCGATILNSQWLLTAASCWDLVPKPYLRRSAAWVGAHYLTKKAARYMEILHVIPHPEYRAVGNGHVNDIALLNLRKTISFSQDVKPVTLPSVDDTFTSSSECWITGWGDVKANVALPDPGTLQQLKISIIPQPQCKANYPGLTSDMICAGDMAGGKGPCKGDYGGPLVCRAGSGFKQVGIMSSGSPDKCSARGSPGVYTQVSKYLRFINDYIHRGEEASAEV